MTTVQDLFHNQRMLHNQIVEHFVSKESVSETIFPPSFNKFAALETLERTQKTIADRSFTICQQRVK